MKYYLSTAGKKCCKGCTWLLSLAKKENGYDLIQLKRGLAHNKHLMNLYPGEPAIILDTGEFYIGDANGTPVLINPPSTNEVVCVVADSHWGDSDVAVVPYSEMITSDGTTPTEDDDGKFGCVVILDEEIQTPIGVGYIANWVAGSDSAMVTLGYFNEINIKEFTTEDVDAILEHAEALLGS